jgi:alkaline phosphatase D
MKTKFLPLLVLISLNTYSQNSTHTSTIGLLGCHVQDRVSPSLDFFADSLKPSYCVWLGDNVYADTEADPQHIQRQYDKLEAKPAFRKLRDQSRFFVTWDDHDFGLNNSTSAYKFKEESKQIFRKFWRVENDIPIDHDGVYTAHLVKEPNGKTIQFIMLDGRFNLVKGKNANALGEKQWKWLEEQLLKPAEIRFVVSGYQILLNQPTRWEAWIKLGKERKRLFELIKKTNANQVVFLTGDQHTSEVLKSPSNVKYKTYEIMACGINQTERPGLAPNRVVGPDKTFHSSPVIYIHWEDKPYLEIKNHNAETAEMTMYYRFYLDDLKWKK